MKDENCDGFYVSVHTNNFGEDESEPDVEEEATCVEVRRSAREKKPRVCTYCD